MLCREAGGGGSGMIQILKARRGDAKALVLASREAFHHDIHYGAPGPGPGGPPGYDSEQWQVRMMRVGDYFKIVQGTEVVGGLLVHPKEPRHYELGRIFIVPGHQSRGIGSRVIELMERAYPLARRWTLDTRRWNLRTQHFYEKMGYERIGVEGPDGILYEKRMERPRSPGGSRP